MEMTPGQALRAAVANETLQIPGAPNALMGRLIERMGFGAVYLSGAAVSAGVLGMPDVGLMTLNELAAQTTYLSRNVALPVLVDADTGFGEAINVQRTVIELEEAGAAAIQLEDQQLPKRCGHLSGKMLVDPQVMCEKIRAAVAARYDDNLVVIARTDACGVNDFDDAVERAKQYLDAGADWIFPEALSNREQFAQFADSVEAPLLANMTEFGKSPLLTLDEFSEMSYAGVLYPVTLLRLAMKAAEAGLAILAEEGSQESMTDLMQTRQELYDLLDYEEYEQQDRDFFSGDK